MEPNIPSNGSIFIYFIEAKAECGLRDDDSRAFVFLPGMPMTGEAQTQKIYFKEADKFELSSVPFVTLGFIFDGRKETKFLPYLTPDEFFSGMLNARVRINGLCMASFVEIQAQRRAGLCREISDVPAFVAEAVRPNRLSQRNGTQACCSTRVVNP